MKKPLREALPTDKVRYVGDPVAFVVAETVAGGEGCGRSGRCRHRSAACRDVGRGRRSAHGAPQLYDDVPGNVALDYHYRRRRSGQGRVRHGGACHQVEAAQQPPRRRRHGAARGAGRFRRRHASRSMSARRACSACAPTSPKRWASTPKDVHVLTGQVGGSFGMKAAVFPEYICVLHAARALGRPVKWTDERSGSFVSDSHGRDHDVDRRTRARCRRQLSRGAADELRQCRRVPVAGRADARHAQCGEERAGHVPHAADRSLDQGACSPTPRTSPPIAAPAGPKATTTWSG